MLTAASDAIYGAEISGDAHVGADDLRQCAGRDDNKVISRSNEPAIDCVARLRKIRFFQPNRETVSIKATTGYCYRRQMRLFVLNMLFGEKNTLE